MNIHSTTDYEVFGKLSWNRMVNEGKVKALMHSILNNNELPFKPMIVTRDLFIMDGQHRLEAAKRLGVAIYYVVDDGSMSTDPDLHKKVADLQTSTDWKSLDYLNTYVAKGINDYLLLKNFCTEYQVAISTALRLLSGHSASANFPTVDGKGFNPGTLNQQFKDGLFRVKPGAYQEAEILASHVNELKPYCEGTVWKQPAFFAALQVVYQKVSHTVLVSKLRTHGFRLRKENTRAAYILQLERIINFRAYKRIQLYTVNA